MLASGRRTAAVLRDNRKVTDRLSLSMWLPPQLSNWRTRYYEKILSLTPFSQREQPQSTLTVRAINMAEPPLLEQALNGPVNLEEVGAILAEYQGNDIAFDLESWWDLWQYTENDWQVKPTRILLSCFAQDFDNGTSLAPPEQEDLRIDFGVDTSFLPQPDLAGSGKLTESNVKSLLHLVRQIEEALPLERRLLETESGENFAEKLRLALGGHSTTQ